MPETQTIKATLLSGLSYLPGLARFIRNHHLDTYVSRQIQLSHEYDLPLLKYFSSYSEEQLRELTKKSVSEFLDSFIENKIERFINETKERWIADQLPYLIKKDTIETNDIILVSLIRKRNLTEFVPNYTTDSYLQQQLYGELDNYFTGYNQVFTEVYMNILKDRVNREANLKENEERLRLALDAAELGTWDANLITRTTVASEKCKKILGISPETQLNFDSFFNCVHPDDMKKVTEGIAFITNGANSKPDFSLEYRVIDANSKKVRWVRANGTLLTDEHGKQYRTLGTIMDITEKKLADDLLIESEQRFRSLIENSNDAITLTDSKGKFLYASPSVTRILGYKEAEILAINNYELFHPDDTKALEEAATVLGEPGKTMSVIVRVKHKNGMWRWVESTFTNLLHISYIGAIVSNIRDITEQKLAQDELQQSELRYSSLTKASTSVIWTADASGAYAVPQDSWEAYTGQPFEQHKGFGWIEMIHPDDRERLAAGWEESLKAKRTHYCWGKMWSQAHQEFRHFTARAVPLLDNNGDVTEWVGMDIDIHDQKLAEEALRQSEEQFRQLADSMPQMVWAALADGTIEYFNRRWIKYTGTTLENRQSNWDIIIHPDDVPASRSAWERSLQSGEVFEVEYRIKNQYTGDYRWFLVRGVPVKDENGTIKKWFGTCTDIHENKEKDEFLKLQARIIDSMAEGVMVLDEHGYIQYTNTAQDRMAGYSAGELLGKHVTILNAEQDEENEKKVANNLQALKEKDSLTAEWHNKRKDGTLFYTESFTTILERDSKKLLVSVQRDITEERRNKQVLEESEKLFRMLAEQSPTLIWMSDEDGNVIYCNKELLDYAGFSDIHAFSDLQQEEVIHPTDLQAMYDLYTIGHEELKPFSMECRLKQAATGMYRRFIFKGVPRFNEGKFSGFIGSAIDIEEQMKTADELEQRVNERTKELLEANAKLAVSNQELEQFAYVASHDLQEPLRKIQAFGDILNNRYKEQLEESGRDMIGRMQSAADRMKVLIEDLLAYSRVSRKVEMEVLDPNKIISEVMSDLYTAIMEKKAKVNIDRLEPITGNALHLRQLFQNLIGNALKFTREGITPEINVTSQIVEGENSGFSLPSDKRYARYQLIEITDNGIGFEQQYAEKIFQMFQRLHGRTEYAGSGVGLSIVQKVVENHHGHILAIGQPGEGATFRILLPVAVIQTAVSAINENQLAIN